MEEMEEEYLETITAQSGTKSTAASCIISFSKLLKKPSIEAELSEPVTAYLQELRASQIYLQSGILNINFAEAALLLQSATLLYAKKVDLLWDCIIAYQERMTLYEEKTDANKGELKRIDELKSRYKRKRKIVEVPAVDAPPELPPEAPPDPCLEPDQQIDCFPEDLPALDVFTNEELEELCAVDDDAALDFEGLCKDNKTFCSSHNWIRWFDSYRAAENGHGLALQNPFVTENYNDYVVMKDAWKEEEVREVDRLYSYPKTKLTLELTYLNEDDQPEVLCNYIKSSIFFYADMQRTDYIYQHESMKLPIAKHTYLCPMEQTIHEFLVNRKMSYKEVYRNMDTFRAYYKTLLKNNPPRLNMKRIEVLAKRICPKRTSIVLERLSDEVLRKHNCAIVKAEVRKTIDSRNDSGFFSDAGTPEKGNGNDSSSFLENGVDDGCDNESGVHEAVGGENQISGCENQGDDGFTNERIIEETCSKRMRKRKLFDEFETYDVVDTGILTLKRAKISQWKKTTTASLMKFEKFFFANYKPAKEEGVLIEPDYSDDDDGGGDDVRMEDLNSIAENGISNETSNEIVASDPIENIAEKTNPIAPYVSDKEDAMRWLYDECTPLDERYENYIEWKRYITPRLGDQKDADFDIHAEGAKIMDSIGEIGAAKKYCDICNGKSARYVSRSFIAMLQLANTENVEIISDSVGKLSNDTLELKLLKKERQNICEYSAPSERTFEERLKRARKQLKKPGADKRQVCSIPGPSREFGLPSTSRTVRV